MIMYIIQAGACPPSANGRCLALDNTENENKTAENAECGEIEVTEIEKKKKNEEPIKRAYDWVEMLVTAVGIVVIVFALIVRIATVDGSSMEKTLYSGEKVAAISLGYEPTAGDIVIVQSHNYNNKPLVKRIIATGGQTLKIDFSTWTVTVDGKTVRESYVYNFNGSRIMTAADYYSVVADYIDGDNVVTVPEGYVFVMGDNRNNSRDSRMSDVGFIENQEVIGKVFFNLSGFEPIS